MISTINEFIGRFGRQQRGEAHSACAEADRTHPTVLVLGYSHTRALSDARAAKASSKANVVVEWLRKDRGAAKIHGTISFEGARNLIARLVKADIIVLSVLGSINAGMGMAYADQPFDVTEETEQQTREDVSYIPRRSLEQRLEKQTRSSERIADIPKIAPCRVYHLTPPPPKADVDYLRRLIDEREGSTRLLDDLAPADLRLKLWQIEVDVMKSVLDEWGITLLPVPPDSLTPDGFLKPEYYYPDIAHGNAAYGELVLRQIEDLLDHSRARYG